MSLRKVSNLPRIGDYGFRTPNNKPQPDDLMEWSIFDSITGNHSSASVKHSDLIDSFPIGSAGFLDQTGLTDNSSTDVPSQRSVKSYVDVLTAITNVVPTGSTMATSGSYTLQGGIIIKYGQALSLSDTYEDFPFPTIFPNNCFTVLTDIWSAPTIFTTTKFTVNRYDQVDSGNTFSWIAIGN